MNARRVIDPAASLGNALAVLAREHARIERAPRGEAEPDVAVERRVSFSTRSRWKRLYSGCSTMGLCRWCFRRLPGGADLVALHSEVPQYGALPRAIMSCIAHTVSSIGVFGSGRWQ
jgi:hypothetical protein